jgi:hypothetical protein
MSTRVLSSIPKFNAPARRAWNVDGTFRDFYHLRHQVVHVDRRSIDDGWTLMRNPGPLWICLDRIRRWDIIVGFKDPVVVIYSARIIQSLDGCQD